MILILSILSEIFWSFNPSLTIILILIPIYNFTLLIIPIGSPHVTEDEVMDYSHLDFDDVGSQGEEAGGGAQLMTDDEEEEEQWSRRGN